jgi:hypothetical protein
MGNNNFKVVPRQPKNQIFCNFLIYLLNIKDFLILVRHTIIQNINIYRMDIMIKNFYEHYFNFFYLYLNLLSKALLKKNYLPYYLLL